MRLGPGEHIAHLDAGDGTALCGWPTDMARHHLSGTRQHEPGETHILCIACHRMAKVPA